MMILREDQLDVGLKYVVRRGERGGFISINMTFMPIASSGVIASLCTLFGTLNPNRYGIAP
jgi:hypothetical protein